jgi:hypothetical protein
MGHEFATPEEWRLVSVQISNMEIVEAKSPRIAGNLGLPNLSGQLALQSDGIVHVHAFFVLQWFP